MLILGASFYAIATLLIGLVGEYMVQMKISQESARAQSFAEELAQPFAEGDADKLYEVALSLSPEKARLLVVDMDGKVQTDTHSIFNGRRIGHTEVVNVLNGAFSDYGFHQVTSDGAERMENRAPFDFLRDLQPKKILAGYFAAPLVYQNERLGLVLYSVSVQDMVTSLRVIQDKMLLYFFAAAIAVLFVSLIFSRIITKPIATLTEGIRRMARGDLSGRVKVGGIDEMARLGETFNQMSEKLESLDISRNEFVSNASHELKTPLATMKIMLESMLYQEDMDPALRTEFLNDINKELDRLSIIVGDLLTLVQTDAHDYRLSRKNILLREVVEETLHRLEPLAKEHTQTITFTAQYDCPMFADPVKLQQAIYNLVDNAIKYSPKGGTVGVSLFQEGKKAVIEVADSGPGIPKKDQAHIFDRFYRVDKARARTTGGNGLGLSIVHQAIMLHEGMVSVHSEEGKGATFRVELPL